MKHYCDINESDFKFHFDFLFRKGPPSGKFWEINIKIVYSQRILRF